MTPVQSVHNQFLGINPLLHDQLQLDGGWDNFHVNHISDLTRFLQRDLRGLGYLAQAEQSLQIRRRNDTVRSPESDVTIYDPVKRETAIVLPSGGLAIPVPELLQLDEDDIATYRAVGVYKKTSDGTRGDAVAWLEVLSPTNKPGGRHDAAYRDKRTALLQAGLVFIELDYLNNQQPTIAAPDPGTYRILVIDPRPDWLSGRGRVYPVQIDRTLPIVNIPLNVGDLLQFDFDAPYQQTYTSLFFGDTIDYIHLPEEFEKHDTDDEKHG
ncbi:MAG: DUF4058 family protein [Chloroflexota bacterium]